jgi:hypothetical protein
MVEEKVNSGRGVRDDTESIKSSLVGCMLSRQAHCQ